MLQAGDRLPELTLRDAQDAPVALSTLHADAPLAAIFLRHFG